jgi:pimeloyl-ACP methyl ester carboxylesterase
VPVEVILPKVDMDMTHGTLATWHVAEGDLVTQGAALFDIETDKAAMEVEAPATGRLRNITAAPGDKVAVGTVIAMLYAEGEAVAEAPPVRAVADMDGPVAGERTIVTQAAAPGPEPAVAADVSPTSTPRATPAARSAMRAAGIALGEVPGTGPLGRVQRDDVTEFLRNTPPPDMPGRVTARAGWSAEAGPLHISRSKGDGTPILLIHGFTADSQSWAPLEKALGPGRMLIRIDLPGHGRSPKRRIADFGDLARMMVESFDDATRDLGQVHLLGHSLGGALAAAIADIRPRRIASVSLIAPAGLGPEIDADTLRGITRATRAESLAPWLRRLTASPAAITDDYVRAAMKLRQDPAFRAAQADMAEVLFPDGVQAFDLRAAFARLEAPAQMLWGRQDHILPWRHALAADGDFGLHLLAGAGHIPQFECPDRVARIVSRLISAVETPV